MVVEKLLIRRICPSCLPAELATCCKKMSEIRLLLTALPPMDLKTSKECRRSWTGAELEALSPLNPKWCVFFFSARRKRLGSSRPQLCNCFKGAGTCKAASHGTPQGPPTSGESSWAQKRSTTPRSMALGTEVCLQLSLPPSASFSPFFLTTRTRISKATGHPENGALGSGANLPCQLGAGEGRCPLSVLSPTANSWMSRAAKYGPPFWTPFKGGTRLHRSPK